MRTDLTYIKVNAYVRFWEDTDVNGVSDNSTLPIMPCVDSGKKYWQPLINVFNGQIVNWEKGKTAATYYKVCDEFECSFLDDKLNLTCTYEGYVPPFMDLKNKGYGDYIIIDIDEDGYIKDWESNRVFDFLSKIGQIKPHEK